VSLSLEMSRADWERLSEYLNAATKVRGHIERAKEDGKQQVTLSDTAIDAFLAINVPPDVWLKLGSLLGEKLRED